MKQTDERQAAIDRFVNSMLATVRQKLFAYATDKQFHQERNLIVQALAWPARWLNMRGAEQTASQYRQIIETVIAGMTTHGAKRPDRFSAYFLHCVQRHMDHHGDEYYQRAKSPRTASNLAAGVLSRIARKKAAAGDPGDLVVERLAEIDRTLRSRGGRRPKTAPDSGQLALFAPAVQRRCVRPAGDRQKFRNDCRTGQNRPDSSETLPAAPADS